MFHNLTILFFSLETKISSKFVNLQRVLISINFLYFALANNEVFKITRCRLAPYSLLTHSWAVFSTFASSSFFDTFFRLVFDVERFNSFARLFEQVGIERKNAFEHFFGTMLLVCVNGRKTSACVADEDCVAEENLIFRGNGIKDCSDRRETDVERIQRMFDNRPKIQLQ